MNHRTLFVTIALCIILVLLSLVHAVIYEGLIIGFIITSARTIRLLKIIFIILTLSFVFASVLSYKFNNLFTRIFYRISAVWIGFAVYFFLASFITIVVTAFFHTSLFLAGILFVSAFLTGIYGVIHAEHISTTNVSIELAHIPDNWRTKKILFMSDLHLGQVHGKAYVKKIIKKIQAIQPDIVFIGGDVYDGISVNEYDVVSPFVALTVPLGIYCIMGNHEEFSDNTAYVTALRKAGMTVLIDQACTIDGVEIIGVDYKTTMTEEKFKTILNTISYDSSRPCILLKHVPLHIPVAEEKGISLQLSGHTHKAQIFPFSLLTSSIFKKFDYGLKSYNALKIYTSSGVGTWGPPLRVGTRSEIVLITLT